jgi:hypothetical protein
MTNIIDSFDFSDVYCPDVEFQRKASTHTLRQRNYTTPTEYAVTIKRYRSDDGIPVTQMDEYFSDKSIYCKPSSYGTYGSENVFPLGKNDMYDDFIFNIEEYCSSKSIIYDKCSNMNKTIYKVPIIGFVQNEFHKSTHNTHDTLDTDVHDEKFIMIRHKLYSLDKYYREVGLDYTEVNIPKNYFEDVKLDETEKYYTSHKTSFAKDNITFSFHHDMKISSLVIKPEKMSFKNVYSDNTYSRYDRHNKQLMRKQKYSIKVLENEPGFISKFELIYRSELTNGQWVKHGIYNGNISIADTVKISFDEIQVKEIRIIPISFHKTFEHVNIKFIGQNDAKPTSNELFVIYEISIPRDGKYLKYSSKISDKYNHSHNDMYPYLKRYLYGKQKRYTRDMIRECMDCV